MLHLTETTIENRSFVFTEKEAVFLGPKLHLIRCTLMMKTTARALTMTETTMTGCTIDAQKPLKNCQMWCNLVLKECKFRGRFVGNDFGHWPEQSPNGAIENCDFSDSILEGCRIMGSLPDTLVFPRWPCFVVLHPFRFRDAIQSVDWPTELQVWASVLVDTPETTTASIDHAPSICKEFKCDERVLRSALANLSNVKF